MIIHSISKNLFKTFVIFTLCISTVLTPIIAQENTSTTDEKSATTLYNEGVAALREKDYKTSFMLLESAFTKAQSDNNEQVLDLAKKNIVSAAFNYGNDLLKAKNTKDAIDVFQRGLSVNESASLMYQGIGRAYEDANDAESAAQSYIAYLDAAKSENDEKKIGDAQSRVKNLLIKQLNAKAYNRIIKIGGEYLEKDKTSEITYLVGKAYAEKGDHSNGIKYMLESIDLSTAAGEKIDDKVYYGLGLAYDGNKDSKNAIKYFSMVTDPKFKASAQAFITKLKG